MSAHQVPAENFIQTLRRGRPVKDMATAHAEDYADKQRMDETRRALEAFVADAPSRCHKDTVELLRSALRSLKKDSDHIVAVYD